LEDLDERIYQGDFGISPSEGERERFVTIVEALGKKAPRLYLGRAEDMHFLGDETVDVIITSPPYNLDDEHWPMGGGGREPRASGIGYDEHDDAMSEDEYQAWQLACLQEMYRVANPGATLFYNHKVRIKDGKAIHPMEWIGHEDNPWTLRQEIVWDRRSTHNHCPTLFWPHDERIYWMTKGKPTLPDKPIGMPTIVSWEAPRPGTWHPAPFHPDLPRLCLNAVGRDGIVVLDPFCGSCTTLKVALGEFGCDAIGVDISENYLSAAREENGWTRTS
jgi:DNA modification methylase